MLSRLLGKGIGRSFLSSKASSPSSSLSSLLALGGLERGLSVSLTCLADFWGEAGRGEGKGGGLCRRKNEGGRRRGMRLDCAISLDVFEGEMEIRLRIRNTTSDADSQRQEANQSLPSHL